MKKQLLTSMVSAAVVAGAIAAPSVATAEDGFSANVAMTTDYRFRGISQNDKDFAIQGGFDYAHDSGFYAGIWASSVDFQIQTVDDASSEVDLYAGFSGDFGNGLGYDVGVLTYQYPNADSSLDYDFTEVYGKLSYKWTDALETTAQLAYTSDYFGGSDDATYFSVAADYEVIIAERLDLPAGRVQHLAILSGIAGFDVRHKTLCNFDDLARAPVADRER